MRWQGGRRGGNIDDRRGMGGGAMIGGGLGTVVLAAIGYFVFGIDPQTTTQLASQFGGAGVSEGKAGSPTDQAGAFVDVIGTNIDDVWKTKIQGYQPPTVTLYEQGTSTGCGFGQAAMGPFYCPTDRHVYLDLSFWSQLETDLGASSADFARAYVIAHEYGHHVQTLTGVSQQVQSAQQRASGQAEANRYSVALELRPTATPASGPAMPPPPRTARSPLNQAIWKPGCRRPQLSATTTCNAVRADRSSPRALPTAPRPSVSNGCGAAMNRVTRRPATPSRGCKVQPTVRSSGRDTNRAPAPRSMATRRPAKASIPTSPPGKLGSGG